MTDADEQDDDGRHFADDWDDDDWGHSYICPDCDGTGKDDDDVLYIRLCHRCNGEGWCDD